MIELLIAIVLAGILATLAVPNFTSFIANNRSESMAATLSNALRLARSEAVKRGYRVSLCAANSDFTQCEPAPTTWGNGWLIFLNKNQVTTPAAATDIIQVFQSSDKYPLTASQAIASFESTGFAESSTANMTVVISPTNCSGNNRRTVTVKNTGRVTVTRSACP